MRWFRFYDDALNDPKVQRLSGDDFKSWVNILCLASKHGGSVPPLADTAFVLRMPEPQVAKVIGRLAAQGLLDDVDGEYRPHNWAARQYASDQSNQRVKKLRNGGVTVNVTPPETEADSEPEPETEKKSGAKRAYPNDFLEFWEKYPTDKNMAKKTAHDVWKTLSSEDRLLATSSLSAFVSYCDDNRSWYRPVHAVKYLRDRRFEGHAETAAKLTVVHSGVFVKYDSDQWWAWDKHYKSRGETMPVNSGRMGGRYLPAEWPAIKEAAE